MPSNHFLLYCPLLLLPSVFPSIRVFSNESVLCIRWPKYWSFNFSISPSNKHWGLISFRMDWLDLLAVQGTLKCLLQHHSSKAPMICWGSLENIVGGQALQAKHMQRPWNPLYLFAFVVCYCDIIWWGGSTVYTYVYLWSIHVDVWWKPTQYSKTIILQLNFLKIVAYFSMSELHPPKTLHRNNVLQKQINKWLNVDFRAFLQASPGLPAPLQRFQGCPAHHSSLSFTITHSESSAILCCSALSCCFHLDNYAQKLSFVCICLFSASSFSPTWTVSSQGKRVLSSLRAALLDSGFWLRFGQWETLAGD